MNVQLVVKEMSPNGKYFNIIKEEIGRDYTEARTLKRKLNNGDWVYVSEVLNELVENKIMIKSRSER